MDIKICTALLAHVTLLLLPLTIYQPAAVPDPETTVSDKKLIRRWDSERELSYTYYKIQ